MENTGKKLKIQFIKFFKMCRALLPNEDRIKILDGPQTADLQDYVNMRNQTLPTLVKWNHIKSMVVTVHGTTLWQMSETYIDALNARAIGTIESPVHLFEWILKESKKRKDNQ